ncbi:antibiotic biosynthesis monooxygenase [Modestobacter sp. Leaf380]|uniref:antibiotic biosynthesis monooxygenase family protein n=1 Tax=Modestobacter sp. Leaf380 TaxID=1736356 RepID=UPI0012FAE544|nr:antibiotic biosynthesis monooxygenase [Modestobacter sp. Leaf380]
MFAVTRFRVSEDDAAGLVADADALLAVLRARPGFRDGAFGRAADEDGLYALVTTWEGVGAYRRALSAAEVKVAGAPVWLHAVDEPGAYLTGE